MSDSVRPHRWQPTRLPRPWDSPGKNTGVGCHFLLQGMKVKSESEVAQSCTTLFDPMDCSPPGSSLHGVFQARVLEWAASNSQHVLSTVPRVEQRVWSHLNFRATPCGRYNYYLYSIDVKTETGRKQFVQGHLAKHLLLLYWPRQSLWLCESQQTVENS